MVTESFFAARDQLLTLQGDPERARAEFRWPDVGDNFNWAHDVFDLIAEDNDTTALWIAEETGREYKRSFRELKRRSDQVANWLRGIGAKRGDIAMLMLGNHVELWEIMLAAMQLGVVILPTSVVLGPQELVDRVERGNVRWVFAGPEDAVKFASIPGDFRGIGVRLEEGTMDQRAALYDWARFEESRSASVAPVAKLTASTDPALLYFTSGTTKLPKIAVHSHTSSPLGHFTTMAWLGVRPGDVHSVISA
ncbi:AMP-dependent synthetase, partial [Providencia rettgeri]|nr:AMP-dependent synthetase [Providencia rettgeri]